MREIKQNLVDQVDRNLFSNSSSKQTTPRSPCVGCRLGKTVWHSYMLTQRRTALTFQEIVSVPVKKKKINRARLVCQCPQWIEIINKDSIMNWPSGLKSILPITILHTKLNLHQSTHSLLYTWEILNGNQIELRTKIVFAGQNIHGG